jgi:hypothetical protein
MYAKRTSVTEPLVIVDRREMLQVKAKSLAAEARIIRAMEKKKRGPLREELYLHRTKELRGHARSTCIALGILKGRTLAEMEPTAYTVPDWSAVQAMLKKYGNAKALEAWNLMRNNTKVKVRDQSKKVRNRVHRTEAEFIASGGTVERSYVSVTA